MGIGGSAISAVAILAKKEGYKVSGCDLETETQYLDKVKKAGICVYKGHDPEHIKTKSLLVISPAIIYQSEKHPEYVKGKKRRCVVTWDDFIGETLLSGKKRICIAGTHGKSTTTAMAGLMFEKSGADPNVLVGAKVHDWDSNFRVGESEIFILESDEFYDKYLKYDPDTIVINNIEFDHPDYFKDEKQLYGSFKKFISLLTGSKNLIVNLDSPGVIKLLKSVDNIFLEKLNLYGYSLRNEKYFQTAKVIRGKVLKSDENLTVFRVRSKELKLNLTIKMQIPGMHNVYNALGVITLGKIFGISDLDIKRTIYNFKGIGRRLELVGEDSGVYVYDDYAHHPTAIRVTLEALRQRYPKKVIWAVVEAHSFSRTKALLSDYKNIFKEADRVIVGPIFKARDRKDFGVTGESIVKASKHNNISYIDNIEGIVKEFTDNKKDVDVVIVMGAGKSYQWARKILKS